ncbi:MAG: hypothetical protein V4691_09640 [Pseudomonadota bacterium]
MPDIQKDPNGAQLYYCRIKFPQVPGNAKSKLAFGEFQDCIERIIDTKNQTETINVYRGYSFGIYWKTPVQTFKFKINGKRPQAAQRALEKALAEKIDIDGDGENDRASFATNSSGAPALRAVLTPEAIGKIRQKYLDYVAKTEKNSLGYNKDINADGIPDDMNSDALQDEFKKAENAFYLSANEAFPTIDAMQTIRVTTPGMKPKN